jgi:hypothetical protein
VSGLFPKTIISVDEFFAVKHKKINITVLPHYQDSIFQMPLATPETFA